MQHACWHARKSYCICMKPFLCPCTCVVKCKCHIQATVVLEETELLMHLELRSSVAVGGAGAHAAAAANVRRAHNDGGCVLERLPDKLHPFADCQPMVMLFCSCCVRSRGKLPASVVVVMALPITPSDMYSSPEL